MEGGREELREKAKENRKKGERETSRQAVNWFSSNMNLLLTGIPLLKPAIFSLYLQKLFIFKPIILLENFMEAGQLVWNSFRKEMTQYGCMTSFSLRNVLINYNYKGACNMS